MPPCHWWAKHDPSLAAWACRLRLPHNTAIQCPQIVQDEHGTMTTFMTPVATRGIFQHHCS
eukprot:324323-Heterocapsa_arctica.AAC.2